MTALFSISEDVLMAAIQRITGRDVGGPYTTAGLIAWLHEELLRGYREAEAMRTENRELRARLLKLESIDRRRDGEL